MRFKVLGPLTHFCQDQPYNSLSDFFQGKCVSIFFSIPLCTPILGFIIGGGHQESRRTFVVFRFLQLATFEAALNSKVMRGHRDKKRVLHMPVL